MAMGATNRTISAKTPINIFFSIPAPRLSAARGPACGPAHVQCCNRRQRHYIDREAIRQSIPDPQFRGGELIRRDSIRRTMGDLVNLNKFRKAKQRQTEETQAGINREKFG